MQSCPVLSNKLLLNGHAGKPAFCQCFQPMAASADHCILAGEDPCINIICVDVGICHHFFFFFYSYLYILSLSQCQRYLVAIPYFNRYKHAHSGDLTMHVYAPIYKKYFQDIRSCCSINQQLNVRGHQQRAGVY